MDPRQKQKVTIIVHQGQGTTKNRLTQKLYQVRNAKNYFNRIITENSYSKITKPDYTVQYSVRNENKNEDKNFKKFHHFIFLPIEYHERFPNYLVERIKSLLKSESNSPDNNYSQNNIAVLVLLESNAQENEKNSKNIQKKQVKDSLFNKLQKINEKQAILHFNNIQQICLRLNINCIPCFDIQSCKKVLQAFQQN